MGALRADGQLPLPASDGPLSTPWGTLDWSQVRELALPGALVGPLGGMFAGGLAAGGGLSLPLVLVAAVGLAVPLGLAGGAYELLLATGRFPVGTLAPAALLWVLAFPAIRVMHAALLDLVAGDSVAVPYGWPAFVIYNVLVAVPFAIGFWWLHENFVPRWWFHIRDRNPVADHFVRDLLAYAADAEQEQERRRQRNRRR
jgi:hypothetical protein